MYIKADILLLPSLYAIWYYHVLAIVLVRYKHVMAYWDESLQLGMRMACVPEAMDYFNYRWVQHFGHHFFSHFVLVICLVKLQNIDCI